MSDFVVRMPSEVMKISNFQVQMMTNCGSDTQCLFPAVVKHLASSDLLTKKLACWFIAQHADQSDLILLAMNSLIKDCQDANPMTRGLALRTLSQLPQQNLTEYWAQPLMNGLKDVSAYVRRVAVNACAKIHALDPSFIQENDLVNTLYGMVRDSDQIVMVNCLNSLEIILQEEGGVVVNRNIAFYLINKLGLFSPWNLINVFKLLKRYHPKTEEESIDIMNIVDGYLKHSNSGVVIAVMEYLLHLVKVMPHLRGEIFKRGRKPLLHCLSLGNSELTHVLLLYIDSILEENLQTFSDHHKYFFCKYNEPIYVKIRKVQLLPRIVSEQNLNDILEELTLCCMDLDPKVTSEAIHSLGTIAQLNPSLSVRVHEKLTALLELREGQVTSEVLKVLQKMDLSEETLAKVIVPIEQSLDEITSEDGRKALLWLIGRFGRHSDASPYILERLFSEMEDDCNSLLNLSLLSCAVRLFLQRPAECQGVLGGVLEHCLSSSNADIKDQALFYYQLLKVGVPEAKRVLLID